jgi:hypothetical protein
MSATVQWRHSRARAILVLDLEEGVLPVDMLAVDAWKTYGRIGEFLDIPFDLFEARLVDLQAQTERKNNVSFLEEQAMVHDRHLHPRATHNHRGEPVFDLSEAKRLLQEDVKNGVHTRMSPSAMQCTRPAYHQFKADIFKFRIYQEVRRQKFIRFLEQKRLAKFA